MKAADQFRLVCKAVKLLPAHRTKPNITKPIPIIIFLFPQHASSKVFKLQNYNIFDEYG